MTRFEEFEKDFEKVDLIKGMRCVKITLDFESDDGDSVQIGLEREGFEKQEEGE